MLKKVLKIVVLGAGVAYVGFCLLVYVCPQMFFYSPLKRAARIEVAQANGYPAQRVDYRAADGTPLYAWYTPPAEGMPIIVFMHGNSYNIESFYHKLVPLAEAGYGTLLPEYRGFGDVEGRITQAGLEQDALAAVRWLYAQGVENRQIYLYGMSLGSYTAAYAAAELGTKVPFAGLILEVPFDSLQEDVRDIVRFPLPLAWIVRDKFDNRPLVKKLHLPILIMAAEDDTLVPARRAEALFAAAAQPKRLITYKGAEHDGLYNCRNYKDILIWLQNNEKAGSRTI